MAKTRDTILDLLREAEEPMTCKDLCEATGLSINAVSGCLSRLCKAGSVEVAGCTCEGDRTNVSRNQYCFVGPFCGSPRTPMDATMESIAGILRERGPMTSNEIAQALGIEAHKVQLTLSKRGRKSDAVHVQSRILVTYEHPHRAVWTSVWEAHP